MSLKTPTNFKQILIKGKNTFELRTKKIKG